MAVASLTEATVWQARLNLRMPTNYGRIGERELSLRLVFEPEDGYEPPQGTIKPAAGGNEGDAEGGMEFDGAKYLDTSGGPTSNTWLLSEDPDDRKDGLWIWGLFEEPLYPFILLKLTFRAIPMPGADVDEIAPFTCYAQLSHVRDRKTGEVEILPGILTVRTVERVKADLAGLASVDLINKGAIGEIKLQPTAR
mmetsp:Transcript_35846/g.61954  ORF Transcript_35846/g.61954 Transcript_35846/m.61954 type:complete len:195 (+) Transcript_35846:16-600(+)